MTNFEILTIILLFILIIVNLGAWWYNIRNTEKNKVMLRYLVGDSQQQKKNMETVGKVLAIFEDETQILRKRREEQEKVKARFSRTPR